MEAVHYKVGGVYHHYQDVKENETAVECLFSQIYTLSQEVYWQHKERKNTAIEKGKSLVHNCIVRAGQELGEEVKEVKSCNKVPIRL